MQVKCLTQYLAHRKLYRVAINVFPVTPGPVEERGRCGRWASDYTDGTAFHLIWHHKQDWELWAKAWDGMLLERDGDGIPQQDG